MIGTVVGNFRIVSQLGKGGMGEVWLAEQQSIKTKVAIKLLRADVSADVSHVQRFFNEAVAVSKIRHAGIVKIFDVGFLGTQAYLVMELLEGETLTRRISRARRLGLREVCDVGRQIAGVLDATHAAGIIHRDLKPDNVFLVPDAELPAGERAKVLDFGIAKLGSLGITSTSVSSMGTPLYMSPEQWRSVAKVDGRADAYSLGCVVFEMACGRPPFLADSMGEACAKHLTDPPPAASSIVPEVPPELDQLVAGLLEKDPAQRPSMKEVMAALDAIAQGLPPTAPAAYAAHGAAPSPPLPGAPVPAGASTVATVGGVSATAPAPAPAPATGTAPAAATPPAPSPTAPPAATTLGAAAGAAQPAGGRRGRAGLIIGGVALVAAGATVAVIAMRAGDGADARPTPPDAPAAEPAPPAPDPPPPQPQQPPPPPPNVNLPLVSPTAVRRISGEPPKNLRSAVAAQLCIDPEGAVTHVEVGLDVEPKVAADVKQKLETWRYRPFRRDGAGDPIAVCFTTMLQPPSPPASGGKPPGGGSGKPPGSGSGSGSGKPPGSGSGSGSGGGSGKPPAPALPEQLGRPEFRAVMKSLEAQLRTCVRRPGIRASASVTVWVGPGGKVDSVHVPQVRAMQGNCIRDIVRGAVFPATRRGGNFKHRFEL